MDRRLVELIGRGERIVDLGCGAGELIREIMPAFKECVGLDVSQTRFAIDSRRERRSGTRFLQANLNEVFPLPDKTADVVVANQVIEHIIEPHHFASEVYRILRHGGRCIVTTPNVRYMKNVAQIVFSGYGPRTAGGNTQDGSWDDGHLHYFTHKDLRELFAGVGFRGIRSSGLVGSERRTWLRLLLARYADMLAVREFLSGVILFWAIK